MNFDTVDIFLIVDTFLLLLIGMGPKIALVPFLQLTQGMESEVRKKIANRMVRTAVGTALLLLLLGGILMRLLHFTPGAANIAGGIVLLILALRMLDSPGKTNSHEDASNHNPMEMAIYPLAVPYLLNPAGITALVILSDDINSLLMGVIIVGLVLLMGVLDFAVFHNMDKLATYLNPARMAVTEPVFAVLLAALAVQLMLNGLAMVGVISLIDGH